MPAACCCSSPPLAAPANASYLVQAPTPLEQATWALPSRTRALTRHLTRPAAPSASPVVHGAVQPASQAVEADPSPSSALLTQQGQGAQLVASRAVEASRALVQTGRTATGGS